MIAKTGGKMRKLFILLGLLFFGIINLQAGTATTLEEAKAMSARTGKPILMDFMTEWWGGCKEFARAAESDEGVQKKLDSVILFQIDCEKGDGIELKKSFNIKGYPTFVLANKDADTMYRWWGYSREMLFDKLDAGFSDLTTIKKF